MAKALWTGRRTRESSYEADGRFEHGFRLGTHVALSTRRKPLYDHGYGLFGRDRAPQLRQEDQGIGRRHGAVLVRPRRGSPAKLGKKVTKTASESPGHEVRCPTAPGVARRAD